MRIIAILLLLLCNIVMYASLDPFRLGDTGDKVDIIYPDQVIEGPDANIYVYDAKDSHIKVFSPMGRFLRSIVGPGEGPGLIKRPDMVQFGFTPAGLLYITEYFGGHRWISLLKPGGSFQGTINPALTNPMYGVERIFALKDGTYLIEFSFPGAAERKGNFFLFSSPQTIYQMDAKGNFISKIKETNFITNISYLERGADLGLPYAPHTSWAPFAKDAIIFTDGMDNILWLIGFNGKFIRKIDTELPAVPLITGKDLFKWRGFIKNRMSRTASGKEWYGSFGKVIEEYKDPVYKKKPYIQSLQVTGEGNIFISSTTEPGNTGKNFWLLNPQGKILAYGILDVFELHLFPHYIFVKKIDEDENMLVYCYKRDKDEISDFKAVVNYKYHY